MSLESDLFARLRPVKDKLSAYGFREDNGIYVYEERFMDGAFLAHVEVSKENGISGKVIDTDLGEEYTAFRAVRRNAYAADVREKYLDILEEIARSCFEPVPFISDQANRLAAWIRDTWQDIPDTPFKRVKGHVFRDPVSSKWYALIGTIPRSKLDPGADDTETEILDLKTGDTPVEERLKIQGVYPAWHMNKQNWYTVILDDTVSDDQLKEMITESRKAILPPPSRLSAHDWLIPSNPAIYDVYGAFKRYQVLHWHTRKKIAKGDTIYIYSAAPVKAVILRCICDGHDETGACIMRVQEFYSPDRYPLAELKAHGLNTVRFITRIPNELKAWLEDN
ncbi:MAG: MmcQ/YjbR family DNA-binding protein [Solobacterium sp.]|nr:MmcQ/YjbR family DNA-binding protein [Solobacterium sp.]